MGAVLLLASRVRFAVEGLRGDVAAGFAGVFFNLAPACSVSCDDEAARDAAADVCDAVGAKSSSESQDSEPDESFREALRAAARFGMATAIDTTRERAWCPACSNLQRVMNVLISNSSA